MESHNINKKEEKKWYFYELLLNHIHITKGFSTSAKKTWCRKFNLVLQPQSTIVFSNFEIRNLSVTWLSENARLMPAASEPVTLTRPNFSIHSSISAGGAFLWATTTRPQNNTSNFLAKAVAASTVIAVEQEASGWSLLGRGEVVSSCRAELLPACLRVLMISGTWRTEVK